MGVHIKRNPVSKAGKQTLFLLTYYNYQPFRESLGIFVYASPKNAAEREHNRFQLAKAEKLRLIRELELDKGDESGLVKMKGEGDFLEYFKSLMRRKSGSSGLYSTWKSTLDHMVVFLNGRSIKFRECDDNFLNGFKDYLLNCNALRRRIRLSNNSANIYISKVKAALNQAVKDKILYDNPCKRVDNVRMLETEIEYLTIEELRVLAAKDFHVPVYKKAFLFGCLTGLRWSDIKKLRWSELVYSDIEKTWKIHFNQQKTRARMYHPISEQAMSLVGVRGENNHLVFEGLTYTAHNNKLLREWVLEAGIQKHITFHCGRHTYAVTLRSINQDIAMVSKLMGHKDIKTTMRYAKITDPDKNRAAGMFPNIGLEKQHIA